MRPQGQAAGKLRLRKGNARAQLPLVGDEIVGLQEQRLQPHLTGVLALRSLIVAVFEKTGYAHRQRAVSGRELVGTLVSCKGLGYDAERQRNGYDRAACCPRSHQNDRVSRVSSAYLKSNTVS